MNKLLSSVILSLGLIFHVFPTLAAEFSQTSDSQGLFVSSKIDFYINTLMFCVFEPKFDVAENSVLRTKNPAEIALFLKNIKVINPLLSFDQPWKFHQKLKNLGSKSNLKKRDVGNQPFFSILDHAKYWGYTVSLKIEYGIIPNHIFDSMDQLDYLELIDPIIAVDEGCVDRLVENLKTNETLKFLSLEYPLCYTGEGNNHVSLYFGAIKRLYNKYFIADLARALECNNTLTSFKIDANLNNESAQILEGVLNKHPSIKIWSV